MKALLSFLFMTLISTQVMAQDAYRWDLQITNPDYEIINHKLDAKSFKPYLKKTSWRCTALETENKGNISLRKLTCDYSIEKAGVVSTTVSCSPKRPYSENILELYDERKDLTFQIMLKCQHLKP